MNGSHLRNRRNSPPIDLAKFAEAIEKSKGPTRAEFDALKAELESLKKLLAAAKKYDEETGQPECETEEKVALLKKLAQLVGVDLSSVFEGSRERL